MSIDKDSFYELLCKTLDSRSGKILPIDKTNESGWRKVLDIEWKGGIHFIVESSKYCWGVQSCYARWSDIISYISYY